MPYTRTPWANYCPPPLDAANLLNMEDGIWYGLAHSGGVRNTAEFLDRNPASTTGGLAEAIADLGGSPGVVFAAPHNHPIPSLGIPADTIPATVHLMVGRGATFTIANGVTLTINGTMEAGRYQIFSLVGTGTVVFGVGAVEEAYPEWWGAKGDGTTDDALSILAAINSFGGNPGVISFNSLATYLSDDEVKYKSDLIFDGHGCTILAKVGVTLGIFEPFDGSVDRVTFRDMIFDGNATNQVVSSNEAIEGCRSYLEIEGCTFQNWNGRLVGSTSCIYTPSIEWLRIIDCNGLNLGNVGAPIGTRDFAFIGGGSKHLLCRGNFVVEWNDTVFAFDDADDVTIEDNKAFSTVASSPVNFISGLIMAGATQSRRGITIKNNTAWVQTAYRGIWLQSNESPYVWEDVDISENKLYLTDDSDCVDSGISASQCKGIKVTENTVIGWGYSGIAVDASDHITITDNDVEESDLTGIYLIVPGENSAHIIQHNKSRNNYQNRGNIAYAGAVYAVASEACQAGIAIFNHDTQRGYVNICDNACYDDQGAATQVYGIVVPGTGGAWEPVKELRLRHNIFFGNVTAKIFILGGGSPNYTPDEQEAWQTPVFENGWVNFGAARDVAEYFKDSLGVVHLKGTVKDGTVGQVIFTLPAGYRPGAAQVFPVQSVGALGRCDVDAAGGVWATAGNNGWFNLDGITFRVA